MGELDAVRYHKSTFTTNLFSITFYVQLFFPSQPTILFSIISKSDFQNPIRFVQARMLPRFTEQGFDVIKTPGYVEYEMLSLRHLLTLIINPSLRCVL